MKWTRYALNTVTCTIIRGKTTLLLSVIGKNTAKVEAEENTCNGVKNDFDKVRDSLGGLLSTKPHPSGMTGICLKD